MSSLLHSSIIYGERYRYLVIYIPGIPLEVLKTSKELSNLIEDNKTLIVSIDPRPPYDSLYYELLLINTSWDISKALIINNTVIIDNKTIKPWNAIDYTIVNHTWGQLDTLFINTRSLDPNNHSRTLNPYYEYEEHSIPSDIIVVPVNGSIKWDLLDTYINITYVNGTYKLTIEGYTRNVTIKNTTLDTDLILLNITREDLKVKPGLYNVKFRIVRINSSHLVLFMLGSRDHRGWFSEYLGTYTKQVLPRLPIEYFKYLDEDDILWVFNEVLSFYNESLKVGFRYKKATVNIFEIPLYEDIISALRKGLINESLATKMYEQLTNAIWSYIKIARSMVGPMKIIFYIPYTYMNYTVENYEIQGLEPVSPGLYRIIGENITQVVNDLIEYNIDFKIIRYEEKYYVLIKYKNYTVNGAENIGYGYLVMNPAEKPGGATNIIVDVETIVGYLASLSHGYGSGFADANIIIDELDKELDNMRREIRDLNNTLSRLNSTLEATQRQLGSCRADYLNLSSRVNELKNELNEIKIRESQWITYALAGTASIFVIIILLYIVSSRGLRKTMK